MPTLEDLKAALNRVEAKALEANLPVDIAAVQFIKELYNNSEEAFAGCIGSLMVLRNFGVNMELPQAILHALVVSADTEDDEATEGERVN